MFGIRRRKSRAVLARAELGESFDHLRQAAAYATGGVGAAVAPRVRTARTYVAPKAAKVRNTAAGGWGSTVAVLAPLTAVTAKQARRIGPLPDRIAGAKPQKMSKKMKKAMKKAPMPLGRSAEHRRRWPMAGLLLVGAIAGTAGVVALRRRRESEWEAYDPAADLDIVHPGDTAAAAGAQPESTRPASTPTPNGRSGGSTGATGRAKPSGTGGSASPTGMSGSTSVSGAGDRTDGVLGSSGTGSGGSRN